MKVVSLFLRFMGVLIGFFLIAISAYLGFHQEDFSAVWVEITAMHLSGWLLFVYGLFGIDLWAKIW